MEVIRLKERQIEEAAHVLGRAFRHDPLMSYVIPEAEERIRLLPERFKRLLRFGCLNGEVYCTAGSVRGIALNLPPGTEWSEDKVRAAGLDELPGIFGSAAIRRLREVAAREEAVRERDMPVNHWYLLLIGVEPESQGHGVGSKLLKPVLSHVRDESVPCYLETEEPCSVGFYIKHGFEPLVNGEVVGTTGVRFWTFRKMPPRSTRCVKTSVTSS